MDLAELQHLRDDFTKRQQSHQEKPPPQCGRGVLLP